MRRQDQISDDELTAVGAAADAWRGGEPDRGYSMALNRFADPADVNTVYAVAHDHTGDAVGVLSLVPWGRHGLSLDVMRRRPDAPNGTTEAMVTAVMSAAAGLGISHVSLNFCMFRHVYADAEGIGAGSVTRFNYSVLGVLDRFWQFQRLYRANQKYQPQWRPRYLCFDGRVALPQVIFAVAAAEGFLPRFPTRHRHTGPQLSDEHLDQLRELDTAPPPEPSRRLPARSDQTRQRLRRLPALEAAGQPPYPIGLPEPTHQLGDLDRCDDPAGHPEPIRVAGRIRSIRDHGGAVFATLVDGSASAQVLLERDRLGSRPVRTFARLLDRGDLIVIDGHRGRSRTGTPTLFVERWRLAAKALHPVPFAHFSDPETRLRQRSTDLLVHPDRKRLLRQRSTAVRALRATLETEGFLEVETPILHTVHGGATARPFTTFINAYGVDLTLRIAPELYLKRLLVGGLGPLFELGRNFRNEGADATHNPEFTSLEAYLPYADYTTMRHLTVRLITAAAIAVHGRPILPLVHRDGATRPFDLTREWAVVPMLDAVSCRPPPPRRPGHRHPAPGGPRPPSRRGCPTGHGSRRHPRAALRRPRRAGHDRAHLLHRLPGRDVAAHRAAPKPPRPGRTVGSGDRRHGDRHRLLRAHRPGRAASPTDRTVPSGRRRRSCGHGDRRGLPPRSRDGYATLGRARSRRRPDRHARDRREHPVRAHLPLRPSPLDSRTRGLGPVNQHTGTSMCAGFYAAAVILTWSMAKVAGNSVLSSGSPG